MSSKKYHTLNELAALTHSKLVGNPLHEILGVADLETATSEDASFYSNPRYERLLKTSQAGVICVNPQVELIEGKNYLISEQPSGAFQKLIDFFHPPLAHPSGFRGIHPTAVLHESVELEENVSIGPYAVIDEGVKIGAHTFVGSGVYIGAHSQLGQHCLIHPQVVIREECFIGNHVIIQPGAIIGSCGFGYITDKLGNHQKLNQVGNVHIEDYVEIGANTTVDRARFKSTIISKGTKIDNLVQIGHGVKIGPHNIIVAQTGIAGSSSTESHVVIGGQVAIAGHLNIEKQTQIAGKSGVAKSLPTGKYGGIPALPLGTYNRNQVYLRNIEKYVKKIEELEGKIEKLIH